MLYTTFRLLREHHACQPDYDKFAGLKGGVALYGDDTPIPLDEIVETMGLADGLWALRAVTVPLPTWVHLMAAEFAERVLPVFEKLYPENKRPRLAIQAVRAFAAGKITREELMRAADAAAYATFSAAPSGAAAYAAVGAAAGVASAFAFSAFAFSSATFSAAAYSAFSAAERVERKWQKERFLGLLISGGREGTDAPRVEVWIE